MFPLIGVGPCAAANHQQKRCADELGEDGPPETHATHVFLTSMTHHVTQYPSHVVNYLHRYVLFQKTDPSYVFKSDLAIMLLLCISKRPRDASCLSVVSFNSTKRRVESFIVSYVGS